MFTWIEPSFGEDEGVENHITARKLFILENEVSEESDIDGYIEFPDLEIIGVAERVAYLMVSVDGVVTVWTTVFNPSSVEYDLPPLGILPNMIKADAITITETQTPPSIVVEGEPFEDAVTLQLTDNTNAYVSGVLCMVYV